MKKIIVPLLFMLSVSQMMAAALSKDINKVNKENIRNLSLFRQDKEFKEPSEIKTKEIKTKSIEEFQKVTIVKSIIAHCEKNQERKTLQNNLIEYSQYIMLKDEMLEDDIIKILAQSEMLIDKNFGSLIPTAMCIQADNRGKTISDNWLVLKNDKLLEDNKIMTKLQQLQSINAISSQSETILVLK